MLIVRQHPRRTWTSCYKDSLPRRSGRDVCDRRIAYHPAHRSDRIGGLRRGALVARRSYEMKPDRVAHVHTSPVSTIAWMRVAAIDPVRRESEDVGLMCEMVSAAARTHDTGRAEIGTNTRARQESQHPRHGGARALPGHPNRRRIGTAQGSKRFVGFPAGRMHHSLQCGSDERGAVCACYWREPTHSQSQPVYVAPRTQHHERYVAKQRRRSVAANVLASGSRAPCTGEGNRVSLP